MISALMKHLWPGPLLFLGYWTALQSLGEKFLRDPGMFWHTRTGEKILAEGFIRSDPYTFTFAGTWWVPYQWLGEVCMAILHSISGLDSLLVVSTATVAALITWLTCKLLRTGLHPIFAFAAILLTVAASSSHYHVRPHLFTFIGMSVTISALIAYEQNKIKISELAWLVPFMILWSNIHGGVLGGLSTLAICYFGWVVFSIFKLNSPLSGYRDGLIVAGIGILCCASIFISPYGSDLPKTWFLITGMPKLPNLIEEHSRFELSNPMGWPVLAVALLYGLILFGIPKSSVRVTWLLPICWLIQAMFRIRHGSIFSIVAMITIIDMWPHTHWANWLARNRPDIYRPSNSKISDLPSILMTMIFSVGLILVFQANNVSFPLFGNGNARLNPVRWPIEVLEELKDREPQSPGQSSHIFNDYIDGGYILYHAPNYRVFVDDRCEVFGDDWLENLVIASQHDTDIWMERWQQQYGSFHFALTRTDTEFDRYFQKHRDEWALVKRGQYSAFYQRIR